MDLCLRYDMNSPPFGAPHHVLYRAAIDQSVWADRLGFNTVFLAEHHGAEHGYGPSPMIHGAAILGATKQIVLHLSALIVTLHDPLRLAEDLAVLDNLSAGRVMLTAGLGYRPHEFAMFGKDQSKRVALLNDALETLKKAWTGEPFEFHSRTVRVTPKPFKPDGPKVILGGSTESSAKRAGRSGYDYLPADVRLYPIYTEERLKAGFGPPPPMPVPSANFVYVTENPDRDWPKVAPHVSYMTNTMVEWAKERGVGTTPYKPATSFDELRKQSTVVRMLTPDECIAYARSLGPHGELTFHALMGGLDPEVSWQSLKLFERAVYPALVKEGLLSRSASQPN